MAAETSSGEAGAVDEDTFRRLELRKLPKRFRLIFHCMTSVPIALVMGENLTGDSSPSRAHHGVVGSPAMALFQRVFSAGCFAAALPFEPQSYSGHVGQPIRRSIRAGGPP